MREYLGQQNTRKALVIKPIPSAEQDQFIWIWFGDEQTEKPTFTPAETTSSYDEDFLFWRWIYHYDAPHQLLTIQIY